MKNLQPQIEELVTANRILAHEDIVDAFGHISCRHPFRDDRFLLSRARAPHCIEAGDIMEFTLAGDAVEPAGRGSYIERYIHAAIYKLRPDVRSVIHSHSSSTIPFGVCATPIRPMLHNCAVIGNEVRIWDSQSKFGDTDLLISSMEMAEDLASFLAEDPAVLMRGHGSVVVGVSVRQAVFAAIKLETSADLQTRASQLGKITFLPRGEVDLVNRAFEAIGDKPLAGVDRAWEYWCSRAGVPYRAPNARGPAKM